MPSPEHATRNSLIPPLDRTPGRFPPQPLIKNAYRVEPGFASKQEAIFSRTLVTIPSSYNDTSLPSLPETNPLSLIPKELLLKEDLLFETRKVGEEIVTGYSGITHSGEAWFIEEVLEPLPVIDQTYALNGAAKELTRRQQKVTKDPHGRTLGFLAKNWENIAQVLTGEKLAKGKELNCWVEAGLNDMQLVKQNGEAGKSLSCGQIDILGEIPGGQFVIIDVKTKKHRNATRNKQLAVQTIAIRDILHRHNPTQPLPNIYQFISIYNPNSQDSHTLSFVSKWEQYLPYFIPAQEETVIYEMAAD